MIERRIGKHKISRRGGEGRRKILNDINGAMLASEYQRRYAEKKKEDKDTNERQDIHRQIVALMNYGFPLEEAVARLKDVFPNSKYQMFFENWVKDQYAKIKPSSSSREDDLSLWQMKKN